MLVSKNSVETNKYELIVSVPANEFEAACEKVFKRKAKQFQVPGFRKGKAPRKTIEKLYGEGIFFEDAVNDLAPAALENAYTESGLEIVVRPEVEVTEVSKENGVTMKATCIVKPDVTVKQYKGLKASKDVAPVTDEEVNAEIERMRNRNARTITVEDRAAQNGDIVSIDFEGFVDGKAFEGGKAERYSLTLGSGQFIPGFEDQIVGMKIGEEKDIDITFPEDYTPELAGKAVVFKIKLNGITTPELPELDDEFAKDVSEFDTLDEYKTSLREDLEKRRKDEAENDFRANILKQAVNNIKAEIPECMILEKVEQTIRDYASNFGMTDRSVPLENLKEMMGLSDDVVENNIRPAAEFQVKTDLLLDKIKDEEKLEVTEEAFNEYLNKVAEDVKATADQLKNYFGEAFIKAEQLKEMATNLIVDSAKVKAAEAETEEKPKKARKPRAPKAEKAAEETETAEAAEPAAEEPKAE